MTNEPRPGWVENRAPERRFPPLRIGEVWASRELAYFFFLRDLKSQYKQTILGVVWVVLGPLTGAISFTFVFNVLAGIETDGSYFALALTGFVAWSFIVSMMGGTAESLLEHEDLITHVSFPMIAAPISVIFGATVDLVVGMLVAAGWMFVVGEFPTLLGVVVGLPAAYLLMILTALGPGLFFAPAEVKYHDSSAILGMFIQVLFFLGTVAYPPELLGERFQDIIFLNPVVGCVALVRWGLTEAAAPSFANIAMSFGVAAVLAFGGLVSFRRNEHVLVDVI